MYYNQQMKFCVELAMYQSHSKDDKLTFNKYNFAYCLVLSN